MSLSRLFVRNFALLAAVVLGCGTGTGFAADPLTPPLYAVIVGGGPDVASNAAQIEWHTRFVANLLPPPVRRVVLFGDGKTNGKTVSYADTSLAADARRALAVLLADHDDEELVLTRAPQLGVPLDGPSRLQEFRHALSKFSKEAAKQPTPLLLYFAGHGTQDEKDEGNTHYDLWKDDVLTVRVLAEEITKTPRQVPIVVVMAQCFSGAFANLLFAHGEPEGALVDHNLIGFFSAQKDREAAGCSYATEGANYQDFSSYFFGALGGHDRIGNLVVGADYDGDAHVSLHEAFCYALIHDQSTDTPVCTSDAFLRRFAPVPDETVYTTPYADVWQEGTPAQRAVLDALSEQLGLSGRERALTVYDRLTYGDPAARPTPLQVQSQTKEQLNALRERSLGALFAHWPALRWGARDTDGYHVGYDGAVVDLTENGELRRSLLDVDHANEQANEAVDNEEAALIRFANLYTHLVEAHFLRKEGTTETKARFEQIWKAEQFVLPAIGGHATTGD